MSGMSRGQEDRTRRGCGVDVVVEDGVGDTTMPDRAAAGFAQESL